MALLLASSLHAQDVITLKKGKTIEGKVIEVTPTKVKYKKASNPEGPTYSLAKSEVMHVQYENGEKESFVGNQHLKFKSVPFGYRYYVGGVRVEQEEFIRELQTNPEAYKDFKQGNGLLLMGGIIGFPSAILATIELTKGLPGRINYSTDPNKQFNDTVFSVGLTGMVAGVALGIIGQSKRKKALDKYNSYLPTGMNIDFHPNKIRIVYSF